MNKYLLEIGVEELPYKFIPEAEKQLVSGFQKFAQENKISFSNIKTFATPRRLTVLIENLPDKKEDVTKTVKGPIASIAYDKNGNLTAAALGFAKKIMLTRVLFTLKITIYLLRLRKKENLQKNFWKKMFLK